MRSADRLALAAAVAVVLASLTITPLTADWSFLGLAWLLVVMVIGLGTALRRIGVGLLAVLAAQLAVWLAFALAVSAVMPGEGESLVEHLGYLWRSGIEHIQSQAAPMAPNDGVKLIFITVVGLVGALTDLVAVGLRRPAWAILPPLTLWLVPAIGLSADSGIVSFLLLAVGYLAILAADGLNTAARWTRGLSRDTAEGYGAGMPIVWRAATWLSAATLSLTLVLSFALPMMSLPGWGWGTGMGGSGPLQLADPTLDLRRNLSQTRDVTVIRYRTDPGRNGVYLRMAALPRFSSAGWTNTQMQLTNGQTLGSIPGLTRQPTTQRTTTVSVLDLGSEYLPLPYATRNFTADGDWAYDENSLIVLTTQRRNRSSAIRNLTYTVQSVDVEPTAEELAQAPAGIPSDSQVTTAVPADLPRSLRDLAFEVTADAQTAAQRAAAIQEYLRSGRFTYSTRPQPGSGYRALENFLLRDRTGYCEQFAASMALMARIVGIPSRVAVGFLPGERTGDSWRVSIRKMHAWPELYFSGLGWVRFEPTPGTVTGAAPAWTRLPATAPSAAPSAEATSSTDAESTLGPDVPSAEATTQAPTTTGGQERNWSEAILTSGLGLAGLVILALPATLRLRRRSARLSTDVEATERVESAWAEIRDTVIDLGEPWPEGSPRSIGQAVGERLDEPSSATMQRVATLVEQSRYGRTGAHPEATRGVAAMTKEIRRGLVTPLPRRRRFLAFAVPRSLFRRRRGR